MNDFIVCVCVCQTVVPYAAFDSDITSTDGGIGYPWKSKEISDFTVKATPTLFGWHQPAVLLTSDSGTRTNRECVT